MIYRATSLFFILCSYLVQAQEAPAADVSIDTQCPIKVSVKNGNTLVDGSVKEICITLNKDIPVDALSKLKFTAPTGILLSRSNVEISRNKASGMKLFVSTVSPLDPATAAQQTAVDIQIEYSCDAMGAPCLTTVPLTRQAQPAFAGGAWGDPHFTLFNKRAVDIYETGVFNLVSVGAFSVQTEFEQCNGASCTSKVAIANGESILRIIIDRNTQTLQLFKGSEKLTNFVVLRSVASPNTNLRIMAKNDPGTYVDIDMKIWAEWNSFAYIDVNAQLSAYTLTHGSIGGILAYNQEPFLATAIAEANRVPADKNFLTCAGNCPTTPLVGAYLFRLPEIKSQLAILCDGYTPVLRSTIPASPARRLQAVDITTQCTAVLTAVETQACTKYVKNIETYIANCVTDANVENAKLAYLQACRNEMMNLILQNDQAAQSEYLELGFGSSPCKQGCNGGTCSNFSCKCPAGFSGFACTYAL